MPEGHGAGLPVRGQSNVLIADLEADVIRILDIRLDAQKFSVECLCSSNVGSGIDNVLMPWFICVVLASLSFTSSFIIHPSAFSLPVRWPVVGWSTWLALLLATSEVI